MEVEGATDGLDSSLLAPTFCGRSGISADPSLQIIIVNTRTLILAMEPGAAAAVQRGQGASAASGKACKREHHPTEQFFCCLWAIRNGTLRAEY